MTDRAIFAFQGAAGSFSHQAALAFASDKGIAAELLPCQSFGEVFEKVTISAADYGVIPLENSSIGSIVANYDLLWTHDCFVVGEYLLPVHHHLIGFAGADINEIRAVYSHPAALDQCRRLFKNHAGMAARVYWDTSASVVFVKESGDPANAAIAGEPAAREYGMSIILPNVEDYPHNCTRFGLIMSNAAARAQPPAQPYKMSFAVELEHKPGTLARLLDVLAAAGANLTKIESRPIGETPWHYRFFVDMEVPSADDEPHITAALAESSQSFKALGRYAPAAG
jgi:prephenate dehydratase